MEHILKNTHLELEKTHNLGESYTRSSWKELLQSFFSKDFKKNLIEYAHLKEEILLEYSSLYSDISKDIGNHDLTPSDLEQVEKSILYITQTIEKCGLQLELLTPQNEKQRNIYEEEKIFFVQLLESFNADLLRWVGMHEKEIFGEIQSLEKLYEGNPLQQGKEILMLQKKRLEAHIENIHNIEQHAK